MDNLLKKKEQEELWEYCNRRPLYRPPITFLSVIEKLILTEFVVGGISACGSLLFYFSQPTTRIQTLESPIR